MCGMCVVSEVCVFECGVCVGGCGGVCVCAQYEVGQSENVAGTENDIVYSYSLACWSILVSI